MAETVIFWTSFVALAGKPFASLGTAISYDALGEASADSIEDARTSHRLRGRLPRPTGLFQMGERYYDPSLGRFTQQDPIPNPLDPKLWNRYVYVGNDPVNFIDPTGLWGEGVWRKATCIAKEWFTVPTSGAGGLLYGGGSLVSSGSLILKQGLTAGGVAVFGTVFPVATAAVVGGAGLAIVAYGIYKAWNAC